MWSTKTVGRWEGWGMEAGVFCDKVLAMADDVSLTRKRQKYQLSMA